MAAAEHLLTGAGSMSFFAALAGVMYATRQVNWSTVGRTGDEE